MPLNVSESASRPVYLTDQNGTRLSTDKGVFTQLVGTDGVTPLFPNPAAIVDTEVSTLSLSEIVAILKGWDGTNYKRLTTNAPSDTGTNGVQALAATAYTLFWQGTTGWARMRGANVFKFVHAQAVVALTGITGWTPAAGKKFRLMGGALSVSAAAGFLLYDGAAGALTTKIFESPLLAAAGVFTLPPINNGPISAAANNTLAIDVTGNATISGLLFGIEE